MPGYIAFTAGDSTGRADDPDPDPGVLRRITLDLLGRPPYATDRAAWRGRTRTELIGEILATDEFWANWLEEQLYYFLLVDNFRPTTDGVRSLPSELARGSVGVRDALHRICLSSSFDRRNPGPDTFVTVVLEQLLGIVVQKSTRELDIGKKLYDGSGGTFLGRAGNSQADVVHIAIADVRSLRHLLLRECERLVRYTPEPRALAAWSAELERDPLAFRSIVTGWLGSPEYERRLATRRPMSNRLFVRALFVDLFDRLPEDAEAQRMRSALDGLADSGPLRSLVARLILDSGKAPIPARDEIPDISEWVASLFERLLGRAASEGELGAFVESFADSACRPETVLYAIVSHPDYQSW